MRKAPDGRTVYIWRGRDQEEDIAGFADAIVEAVKLYNQNGGLTQPDATGELRPVNKAGMHDLITKNVCGVKVVRHNGAWQELFFSYQFDPRPRINPTWESGLPKFEKGSPGPDAEVLNRLYQHELLCRVPRVES